MVVLSNCASSSPFSSFSSSSFSPLLAKGILNISITLWCTSGISCCVLLRLRDCNCNCGCVLLLRLRSLLATATASAALASSVAVASLWDNYLIHIGGNLIVLLLQPSTKWEAAKRAVRSSRRWLRLHRRCRLWSALKEKDFTHFQYATQLMPALSTNLILIKYKNISHTWCCAID